MNRLALVRSSILFNQARAFSCSKPNLVFGKDFKPGPYPKTEAERIAAAKKYGLKPEDYEPYPDNGFGFGDYPNLGSVSTDMKSDWGDYDDPYLKRNYGEPINVTQEQITADKVTLAKPRVSFSQIIFWFVFGGFAYIGLNLFLWDKKCFVPLAPKQYPRNALNGEEKHYKF
ncbi:NADH dehydrogenase [ubiquinone] 1 beta subcomplex subunit mitochondrial [Brachionus plicatilis]|uniref:NADH dehydrogenase [ubiquinone] 1 beta subcomplex subunit mitochondrial n=1 Tax=Brachionus plicatilis TaxID=10195 RepID=A0A3M7S0M6_BRAPC|nr:NADH dehydrogenase [ubiquinone] 1 beta subcomplex subunit mitochondrial [Brachionus plicatilis]RNA29381.1 NADH dehydrogenase [ubiquinone] 1 beta subcomplex subunit mitochondrial [Brachionus plicatilis]